MHPQKSTTKFGNEHEAIAVYHMMKGVQKFCPIYTLAVGNAFGEAALLLSAGTPVRRAAIGWGSRGACAQAAPHGTEKRRTSAWLRTHGMHAAFETNLLAVNALNAP